jgi:hypothetical protein
MAANGIVHSHFPGLVGHRADFLEGLSSLLVFAEKYLVAMVCAESQWTLIHYTALIYKGLNLGTVGEVTEPNRA